MKPNGHGGSNGRELLSCEHGAQLSGARMLAAAPEMEFPPAQDYVSLATYWHILLKRRWTLMTTMVVLLTLVAIGSFRMTPIYRGTSRVQVEADNSPIQSLNDLYQKQSTDDAFLQTQIQVLKSDSLAWQTIEQLRLAANRGFIAAKALENRTGEEQKVR